MEKYGHRERTSSVQCGKLDTACHSAVTDDEIAEVNTWVKEGGSLFLIADHMPFPGAAEKLAASFGFKFYNGFAEKKFGKDIFTPGNSLMTSAITKGRNEKETSRLFKNIHGAGVRDSKRCFNDFLHRQGITLFP